MLKCVEGEDKVNVGKSKVMVLDGEDGLESEVHVDGISLEHVSKFKYLGCLDESGGKRKMVWDRSEWLGFVRGNAWGVARGMNP